MRLNIIIRGAGIGLILATPLMPLAAKASETVTYTYDALGRLVKTERTGGPASGVVAQTQYDPAGNRSNVTVSNASTNAPPMRVVVLPINGYTIVPLGN